MECLLPSSFFTNDTVELREDNDVEEQAAEGANGPTEAGAKDSAIEGATAKPGGEEITSIAETQDDGEPDQESPKPRCRKRWYKE